MSEGGDKPWVGNALRVELEYDLTGCGKEALEVEKREEALLQCRHAGETGSGGSLPLAWAARVDDRSFADAA